MGSVSSIITQLKKEKDRVERQLTGLNAALKAFANVYGATRGLNPPARSAQEFLRAGISASGVLREVDESCTSK